MKRKKRLAALTLALCLALTGLAPGAVAVTVYGYQEGFAQAVREDINPRDSWRAARDFRLHIAVESAKRAFIESVKLAGGEL